MPGRQGQQFPGVFLGEQDIRKNSQLPPLLNKGLIRVGLAGDGLNSQKPGNPQALTGQGTERPGPGDEAVVSQGHAKGNQSFFLHVG